MRIPPENECMRMLNALDMPAHIQAHSRQVCRVAMVLTEGLVAAGIGVNRELIYASALLHDITKPRSFKTRENHAQTGGEYLTAQGYPEIGNIVRQHVMLDHYFAAAEPTEAEVVNYADKRVLHDQVVSLEERMTYILNCYAKTTALQELLHTVWQQTLLLEERLFSYLSFSPDSLSDHLPTTNEKA